MEQYRVPDINQLREIVISKMRFFSDNSGNRIFSDVELSNLSRIEISYLSQNSVSRAHYFNPRTRKAFVGCFR